MQVVPVTRFENLELHKPTGNLTESRVHVTKTFKGAVRSVATNI